MARKTAEDTEKTRQLLLEKAGEVFFEKGVARTTLNDVAAAAGLSRGAIYHRYRNKAELLRAFIDEAMAPTERIVDTMLEDESLDAIDKLRRLLTIALEIPAQNPEIRRAYAVLAHRCEFTREFREEQKEMDSMDDEYRETLETLIREAQEAGQFRTDIEPNRLAFATAAFVEGVLHRWTYDEHGYGLDLGAAADDLVTVFLDGLTAR